MEIKGYIPDFAKERFQDYKNKATLALGATAITFAIACGGGDSNSHSTENSDPDVGVTITAPNVGENGLPSETNNGKNQSESGLDLDSPEGKMYSFLLTTKYNIPSNEIAPKASEIKTNGKGLEFVEYSQVFEPKFGTKINTSIEIGTTGETHSEYAYIDQSVPVKDVDVLIKTLGDHIKVPEGIDMRLIDLGDPTLTAIEGIEEAPDGKSFNSYGVLVKTRDGVLHTARFFSCTAYENSTMFDSNPHTCISK